MKCARCKKADHVSEGGVTIPTMSSSDKLYTHQDSWIENKRRTAYPPRSNHLSSIGHPCLRFLVLKRTQWDKAPLTPISLQYVFEEGTIQHDAVERQLRDMGIKILMKEIPLHQEEENLSGRADLIIELDGEPVNASIKTIAPWKNVRSLDDFKNGLPHEQCYIPQIQMENFLLLESGVVKGAKPYTGKGVFVIKRKGSSKLTFIDCDLDLSIAKEMSDRARNIEDFLDAGLEPGYIDDPSVCARCPFFGNVCNPPLAPEGSETLDADEIIPYAQTFWETKDAAYKHKKASEAISKFFSHHYPDDETAPKGWKVEGYEFRAKRISKKGYTVKDSSYVRIDKLPPKDLSPEPDEEETENEKRN